MSETRRTETPRLERNNGSRSLRTRVPNLFMRNPNFLVPEIPSSTDFRMAELLLSRQKHDFLINLYVSTLARMVFSCYICKSPMLDTSALRCGHMFCHFCISSWLLVDRSCPMCGEYCRDHFIKRVYDMESCIEEIYPLLRFTFVNDEEDPFDVPNLSFFSDFDQGREIIDSPAQEFPFYSVAYRDELKEERRQFTEANFHINREGFSMLQNVMEAALDNLEGLNNLVYIAGCTCVMMIIASLAEMEGPSFGFSGPMRLLTVILAAAFMTWVWRRFNGDLFDIHILTAPITDMLFKQRDLEDTVTLNPAQWGEVLGVIIDTLGVDEVIRVCGADMSVQFESNEESDNESDINRNGNEY